MIPLQKRLDKSDPNYTLLKTSIFNIIWSYIDFKGLKHVQTE